MLAKRGISSTTISGLTVAVSYLTIYLVDNLVLCVAVAVGGVSLSLLAAIFAIIMVIILNAFKPLERAARQN